jgi:hypothetical protein
LHYDEHGDPDSPLQGTKTGASQPVALFFPHPPTAQAFTEQSSLRSFENSRNI